MEREEGEWTEVVHRRQKKSGVRRDNRLETYFFKDFPEQCSEAELRREFEAVGRVEDLFIPAKRDRRGNRFGFVRFNLGGGVDSKLESLNRIWIGSYVLRAFIPRYERPKEMSGRRTSRADRVEKETGVAKVPVRTEGGETYAEMTRGNVGLVWKRKEGEGKGERAVSTIRYSMGEGEGLWLQNSMTGCLKKEFSWVENGKEIRYESGGNLRITDMGNNLVLLESGGQMRVEEVLKGLDEWVSFWFEWWRPWRSSDVCTIRSVWTRWRGVPLNAWAPRFFESVCSKLGVLEEIHEATLNRRRLDVAFVKVRAGFETIDRCLDCEIDGDRFKVKVEELCCSPKQSGR